MMSSVYQHETFLWAFNVIIGKFYVYKGILYEMDKYKWININGEDRWR